MGDGGTERGTFKQKKPQLISTESYSRAHCLMDENRFPNCTVPSGRGAEGPSVSSCVLGTW